MRTSAASEHRLDRLVGRLNPYMAYCGDPAEGAALVFAESAKEARRLAFDTLRDWFDAEWIDTRVRRLRKHRDYLMGMYDGTHAVCDDPDSCDVCGTWGAPHDATGCEHCRDDCDGIAMPPNTGGKPRMETVLQLPRKRKLGFEYYYRSDGCKAVDAEAPDCTCWHAEGSGPWPNERHDSETPFLNWRIAPANDQVQP